jgi:hypothetical protein
MRTKLALLGAIGGVLLVGLVTFFGVQDADATRHPLPPVNASADHASVPDGGTTVMLMGLGLGIIGAVRRWLIA